MIKKLLLFLCLFYAFQSAAQVKIHSHNDYLQPRPFYDAIAVRAFSIEADVFLVDGKLFVAHEQKDIKPGNTLEELYLKPIRTFYKDPQFYNFQLMIDIKTDWITTYPVLLKLLERYKLFLTEPTKRATIVISGNRPDDGAFRRYPEIIHFDGVPGNKYAAPDLNKVIMLSDNFANYTAWKGVGELPAADLAKLQEVVKEARKNRKFVRFWNTPDVPACWSLLAGIGAYVINTDKLTESSEFFKNKQP